MSTRQEVTTMVQPIPDGLENTIIPYLMIDGARAAMAFYEKAFDATTRYALEMPDGNIGHAEIEVGGATVYLADAPDDMPGDAANPRKLGGSAVMLHRYVADVDAAVQRAADAGATVLHEPTDQFYGDRAALVADPYGHLWSLHQHVRDVSEDEMQRAIDEMSGA